MRTFVAIDLPEELKSELTKRQEHLKNVARGARWVRPEGIHLTLKFLGEISDKQAGQVTEILSLLPPFEPLEVRVEGFGFFPNARRPRVLWVGIKGGTPLETLASEVERSLKALGFPREQRPFRPHLTLARFPNPRSQPQLEREISQGLSTVLGALTVRNFSLIESRLLPQGAIYRKMATFPYATNS